MTDLAYDFTFPYQASGLTVEILSMAGDVVDSGTLPARIRHTRYGVTHQSVLPSADYSARVESELLGEVSVAGVVNIPASIAAASGGGSPTADTAFLIVTGSVSTDNAAHILSSIEWDDRFSQVDWLSISNNSATIPDGAGRCTAGVIWDASIDFSETTAPDSGGYTGGAVSLYADSDLLVTVDGAEVAGDGSPTVAIAPAGPTFAASEVNFEPGSAVVIKASVYGDADGNTPILDGVATVRVAVAITRGGSAPTLPA